MSAGAAAKGIDLDQWFDPYQPGTTKARAVGGGIAGANLSDRYANVIYGSQVPATGIYDKGVDICTLYAQKGTASYPLPINGQTYSASAVGSQNHGSTASLAFTANPDGTYTVVKGINNSGTFVYTTLASGTWNVYGVPASQMQALLTTSIGPQGSMPLSGSWTNNASSWTTITAAIVATDSVSVSATAGTQGNAGTLQIQFKNTATGAIVSTSTIYFDVDADGST